jgi:hypothetical protein
MNFLHHFSLCLSKNDFAILPGCGGKETPTPLAR